MGKTDRLNFITYLELIKKSLSGNNSNTAVGNEILYSYRAKYKTDPEDDTDVLGFSRSAIACWLKGKRKLDTKIRKFYLVNGQKHALYDVEYMRDELKSFYAFSEELYHIAAADTTIPEDIKKELLSAWGYEDEKRYRFVAAVQLYVLDLADDNDVEEDTEEKELIASVMEDIDKVLAYDSIHHTNATKKLMNMIDMRTAGKKDGNLNIEKQIS